MPRLGVFGGVYANPHALRAVLADARAAGADELFCLGDLGGFGAECDPVWPLLQAAGVRCIAGNYDIAIGRGDEDCGCGYTSARDNAFAQLMYDHTRASTSADFAAWMRALPGTLREDIGGCDVLMVHGSPLAVNDFLWESLDDDDLRLRLDGAGPRPDVLLCTHTGLHWQRRVDDVLVVNVGACGRPANDGTRDVHYALVDLEDGEARAELRRVAYDADAQAASMRAAGLPEAFVETIETGWWTTCLEAMPPAERARGRYHVYREAMPAPASLADAAGWAEPAVPDDDGLPVVPLFGSALFPPRLWVYTNFHCNLACDYCVVGSSPQARRRAIGVARFAALVDDAVAEGFTELYLTGGEPFAHPAIAELLAIATARLPTVVLTNAMLLTGRRRTELAALADRVPADRLVLQSSVDGANPATHDRWRGEGSWARAMEGLAAARDLGLHVRVAMTETPDNRGEEHRLREVLAGVGVAGEDLAVRPLVARGFAEGAPGGLEVTDAVTIPELTVTADGLHWHPLGADRETSPDFLVADGAVSLAEAKRLVVERFLSLRAQDGTLPDPFRCAV